MPRISHPIAGLAATLVAGWFFAAPAGAETLADLAERIDHPRLGGVIENPGPIQLGRAVLMPNGAQVRVLLAEDEPCGLYVSGPATLTYKVEDRFSRPVAKRNLRKLTSLKPSESPDALTFAIPIDDAVLWGWDLTKDLPAAAASPSGGLPKWAEPLLERPYFDAPHVALIAARRLGGAASQGVVRALLHGKDDLLLSVDPLVERQEWIGQIARIPRADSVLDAGRHYTREIAAQPIGRAWWETAPAALVAEHQVLKVDNDQKPEKRHVTVTSTTRVRATGDPAGVWTASLADRVVDDYRAFPVRVSAVEVNGQAADFLFRNGNLLVALDPPLAKGQTAEVRVVHDGDYAIRYGGDNFWSLGTWSWFPTPPLNAWLATLELEVRVPEPLTAFVSGATVSKESRDGFTVVRGRFDQPMQWPVIAAGKYFSYSDRKGDVAVSVSSYARPGEQSAKRLANNFFAARECYENLFKVPYPFSEVEVIEINTWGFGQAPPGVIFITQEAFNSTLEGLDRAFSGGVNGRYMHEIAHSYWPHVAKMDAPEENWTSESFADYTSAVCLDALGKGRADFSLKSAIAQWRGRVKDLDDGTSIYLANHHAATDFFDAIEYQSLLYAKGPLVLHALRLELQRQAGGVEQGDRQFWALLRAYLKNFPYRWAGTRHLVGILNQITGKEWQPWFERYVYGTEMPPLK
jgi:hypothetical protein